MKVSSLPNPDFSVTFKILLFVAIIWTVSQNAIAQTNTFPGSGGVGIGTTSPGGQLDVRGGPVCISDTSPYACPGGAMQSGSLTIGDLLLNYGGGSGFTSNTAGLLLETNGNTEIAVHDYANRVASLLFFEGDSVNRITVGRDMAWGAISTIALNGNVGIGTSSPSSALHVVGDVTVTGNISAKYQDVAEWVPSTGMMGPGTVVIQDPDRSNSVMASAESYDTRVAGVVSANPGIVLGEAGEGKVRVATTGRVKVHVDATRSPIRAGDLLVTGDKEGTAMRSEPIEIGGRKIHQPGTLIGKALEPLKEGEGDILVLLSLQ